MKAIFFKKTTNIRFFLEFIKNKFIKFLCNLLVINILIYHTFWITTGFVFYRRPENNYSKLVCQDTNLDTRDMVDILYFFENAILKGIIKYRTGKFMPGQRTDYNYWSVLWEKKQFSNCIQESRAGRYNKENLPKWVCKNPIFPKQSREKRIYTLKPKDVRALHRRVKHSEKAKIKSEIKRILDENNDI